MPGPFRRYLLFQIPGAALVALLLFALERAAVVPPWAALAILAAWIAKDLLLYPFLGPAYAVDAPSPVDALIGQRGLVVAPLAPAGYVRIRGELWRAEAPAGSQPLAPDTVIVVREVRGMTVLVEPDRGETPA